MGQGQGTRSKLLVLTKRSCHKEYTCVILKALSLSVKQGKGKVLFSKVG